MTKLNRWRMGGIWFLLIVSAVAAPAQGFQNLFTFAITNGEAPEASLVQGADGNLYGTTSGGGANDSGTVFKIAPNGLLTTLYSFCSQANCADGGAPYAGLVLGTDGSLYGTTLSGGAAGHGTIFKTTPNGDLTTLYSFCSLADCTDGVLPYAGLTQATDGNFYGATSEGGSNPYCEDGLGCGTVFRVTSAGVLTTLYNFCPEGGRCPDGAYPRATLIQASDGNLYGTTFAGGTGGGTVFKISLGGAMATFYSFCSSNCLGGTDGSGPYGGVMQATNGSFYGTTSTGYCQLCQGTVYEITRAGKEKTLYRFCPDGPPCTDGGNSQAGLVEGTDGFLFGTALGFRNPGAIFGITTKGAFRTLHNFKGPGAAPLGGLVQSTNGTFYGTTVGYSAGTVYSLGLGLGPFVAFAQPAGKVSATAEILGQDLTGSTNVSFNGTSASFTVVSDTFIQAAVPAGATTGYVTVTTPNGTLTSNVPFHVLR